MGGLIIIMATLIPVLLFTKIYQCVYRFAYSLGDLDGRHRFLRRLSEENKEK